MEDVPAAIFNREVSSLSLDVLVPYLHTCSVAQLFRLRRLNSATYKFVMDYFEPEAIDLSGIQIRINMSNQCDPLVQWLLRVIPTVRKLICRSSLPMLLSDFKILLLKGAHSLEELCIHNGFLKSHYGVVRKTEIIEDGIDKTCRALLGLNRNGVSPEEDWPCDFSKLKSVRWTYDKYCGAYVPTHLEGAQKEHSINTLKPCVPPLANMPNIESLTFSVGGWFHLYRLRYDRHFKPGSLKECVMEFRDYQWMTREPEGLTKLDQVLGSKFGWTCIRHTRLICGETFLNLLRCRIYNLEAGFRPRPIHVAGYDFNNPVVDQVMHILTHQCEDVQPHTVALAQMEMMQRVPEPQVLNV